jgi:hypothetical protein
MRRLVFTIVLAMSASAVWAEQATVSKNNAGPANVQTNESGAKTDVQQQPAGTEGAQVQNGADKEKKPGTMKRLKRHLRNQVSSGCVQPVGACWDKPPQDEAAQQPQQTADVQKGRPPRSTSTSNVGESSSKSTKIDLSPPPGEAAAPGVGTDGEAAGDVQEMKPWDPHKADKNVEVGDFYFKRGNYRAAQSRYREALYWKDNDAIAMFRLAQTQEKLG